MSYRELYNNWLKCPYFDEGTKAELKAIEGDEKESKTDFTLNLNLVQQDLEEL